MGLNILDSVTYYKVDLEKIDAETRKRIEEDYGSLEEDNSYITITAHDIDRFNINSEAVDWHTGEFMEDELEWLLESYLNSHPHYLVFASGCRWNGSSGYMFCEDIKNTVYRNYDITLTIEEQGESCIKCRESSHDVPMGSTTIIVGLTEDEYERLEDAEFDEIEDFVMSKF